VDGLLWIETSAFAALEVAEERLLFHRIRGGAFPKVGMNKLPKKNLYGSVSSFPRLRGAGFGTWSPKLS